MAAKDRLRDIQMKRIYMKDPLNILVHPQEYCTHQVKDKDNKTLQMPLKI
jgi:hypothetical protein